MITINLLPISAFREQFRGKIFLASLGLFLLIAIVALFSIKTNIMDDNIATLTSQRQSQQSRLDALKRQVTEADKVTADTVKHWQQLMAVIDLEERRRDQTRLLVEMDKLLPKENAWLLSLNHDAGVLSIEGISTDKETVSQFLTRLENAAYIDRQSVNLVDIAQNMVINNIKLTKFRIKANTVFPQPAIIKEGLPEYGLPTREQFLKVVEAAAPTLVKNIKESATKSGKAL